jgi:predicted AlkP superfamily pyrophosphatase or phosphodiesterase
MRRTALLKRISIAVWTTILLASLLLPGAMVGRPGEFPRRPKLLLVIVIDQFRYDYLARFRHKFVAGGFNLLLTGGACFADCRYDYATTATGPGHATLLTGAYPNVHGIIGNEWYDHSLRRIVNCVEDPATKLVSGPDAAGEKPGFSPHYLIGSTLGDELRAATDFRSKVVAIALKDRAAVLPGGHSPTAAYWYDSHTGRFVTSTYYMASLPGWVVNFNQNSPAKSYCGQKWAALPESGYGTTFSEFKPSPNEACPDPKFLGWLERTPYMNEIELAFAEQAIKNEHLGKGDDTDLLTVSLSVNDYIGHGFGPYSAQVGDTTLRTDRDLASFFAELGKLVGLSNVWIAFSADHGVSPTPEFIQAHKLGAGTAQPDSIRKAAEEALSAEFGKGNWIAAVDGAYIYLDSEALIKQHIPVSQAEEVAAAAAASVPGVMAAFTRAQILAGGVPASPLARKVSNSFNGQRGGDVFVVLDPYALPVAGLTSTTHGGPWNYDAQVPLILWGGVFKPGIYFQHCQPIDLAATLAAALGLTQPSGSQGNPLAVAIQ